MSNMALVSDTVAGLWEYTVFVNALLATLYPNENPICS